MERARQLDDHPQRTVHREAAGNGLLTSQPACVCKRRFQCCGTTDDIRAGFLVAPVPARHQLIRLSRIAYRWGEIKRRRRNPLRQNIHMWHPRPRVTWSSPLAMYSVSCNSHYHNLRLNAGGSSRGEAEKITCRLGCYYPNLRWW